MKKFNLLALTGVDPGNVWVTIKASAYNKPITATGLLVLKSARNQKVIAGHTSTSSGTTNFFLLFAN